MAKENKKKPNVDVNDKVLWTGCDRENYEAKVLGFTDVVGNGPLVDLEVVVVSPFSGQKNYYRQSSVPYSKHPGPNTWRPYPKDE
jgi:hypothetical protein